MRGSNPAARQRSTHRGVVARAVGRVDERERVVARARASETEPRAGERMVVADRANTARSSRRLRLHDAGAGCGQKPSATSSSPAATSRTSTPVLSSRAPTRTSGRSSANRREPLREVVGARGEAESQLARRAPPACSRATASTRVGGGDRGARVLEHVAAGRRQRHASASVRSSSVTPSWRSKRRDLLAERRLA